MGNPTPENATDLLREFKTVTSLKDRLEAFSARFLNLPYVSNPLGGGPAQPESLVIRFDGFDCVTYIETVLALAYSADKAQFSSRLQGLRYVDGDIVWHRRNHYMVDWIRNNQARRVVKDITQGMDSVTKQRRLSLIKEIEPRDVRFNVLPKQKLPAARSLLETGVIALFASTRRNLDVFHMGMIVRQADSKPALRHASRTARRVIEQPLEDFLKAYRMSGLILLRPLCPSTHRK